MGTPAKRREVKPWQLPEWKMALDNMEQMHPRRLVQLVESGELEGVLTNTVRQYLTTVQRVQAQSPQTPFEMIREMVQAEYLTTINPNWQDEKPLTREEKTVLRAYLKSLRG